MSVYSTDNSIYCLYSLINFFIILIVCSLVKDLQNKGFILADPTSHIDNLNDVGILIGVGVVLGGTIAGNSVTSCNMVATVYIY